MSTSRPIAHVRFDENKQAIEHWLDEHLHDVAELAAGYASDFQSADWAKVAGLWHDLGKYNPEFQHYIGVKSGYNPNAHIEQAGKVNHSAAGALYAASLDADKLKRASKVLGYLIAGHHSGLPDWFKTDEVDGRSLDEILQESQHLHKALQVEIPADILKQALPKTSPKGKPADYALWVRMLFSSLVDADFLDTERFMQPEKFEQRSQYPNLTQLLNVFNQHMQTFAAKAPNTPVNQLRAQVLQNCRQAAQQSSSIFSLTVPTGGGKTLSGMAFALEHAVKYHKERIIYAIPYTSIIEQTANIYRSILGNAVIEHHSNLDPSDPEKETAQSRLAAENWDAPIIVTTNVQLFESLFASRTSRCRKLHNLANSVIVLDEAQLLPPEFLNPILQVMKSLLEYDVTFVLSTATQPALQSIYDTFDKPLLKGFEANQVSEIIPDCAQLFADLERVEVSIPDDLNLERSWEHLAQEIVEHETVLVIVNTKQQAAALCRLLPADTYYLSTNLCGEHRSEKLKEIREKLKAKQSLRVVSTQLIEAGVDVDFPVVYRALAGLDSLAQAAGRCNREGLLVDKGRIVVFVPPNNHKLKGQLGLSASVSKSLLPLFNKAPLHYTHFQIYFEHFYTQAKSRDAQDIEDLLCKDAAQLKIQFRTAAQRFRLINDEGYAVFVTYGAGAQLLEQLKKAGPYRELMRKLQRYTVTIREQDKNRLVKAGDIRELTGLAGVYELMTAGLYDQRMGLMSDPLQLDPQDLVW